MKKIKKIPKRVKGKKKKPEKDIGGYEILDVETWEWMNEIDKGDI